MSSESRYRIYPKQFRWEKIPIERNKVFVLMPFTSRMDAVYGRLKAALSEKGYLCSRADELDGSVLVMNTVLREIMRSRYVIADLTLLNPNVFYELGVTHSFKDLPNVVMIKQKEGESPFDISHLRYIEYSEDNLFLLTSQVLDALERGGRLSDFQDALNRRGILGVVSENRDDFIDMFQDFFDYDLEEVTSLLNGDLDPRVPASAYMGPISRIRELIVGSLQSGRSEVIDGIVRIYAEALSSAPATSEVEEFAQDCLSGLFAPFDVPDDQIDSWKIDFAVTIASRGRCMVSALSYLIGYLSKIKTTRIDLNRYKVERFLLISHDGRVDEALINALGNEDRHIREYVSDLIGDKGLASAHDYLVRLLESETNPYTARSMLRALGKIGTSGDAGFIARWVDRREDTLRRNKATIVVRHAYLALRELCDAAQLHLLDQFQRRYADMLDDPPLDSLQ